MRPCRPHVDGLQRLGARPRLPRRRTPGRSVQPKGKTSLRVAHGMPFNDYIAASIESKPATGGAQTTWLVLVETIAAGTEGTPVERNLVRNLLVVEWDGRRQPAQPVPRRFFESRPMALPARGPSRAFARR